MKFLGCFLLWQLLAAIVTPGQMCGAPLLDWLQSRPNGLAWLYRTSGAVLAGNQTRFERHAWNGNIKSDGVAIDTYQLDKGEMT